MPSKTILYENVKAELKMFGMAPAVREYHVMFHITNPFLTFNEQTETLIQAYETLATDAYVGGAQAVFMRFFLSDAANQADTLMAYAAEHIQCAVSTIEQAPLDGTKVALWVWMQTDVNIRTTKNGLYEVEHGAYKHLWTASNGNRAANSEYQTRLLLNDYVMQLMENGCKLAENCIRTWFFVSDIDLNYSGVVRARNEVFFTQALTDKTHFIASTGIGGRQAEPRALVQMDAYAVDGISQEQVRYLYAATHLNRTSEYGVSFERGTCVDYGDRRHVFISGTASINNRGEIVHTGDVVAQTRRMWENVETLLAEAGCTYDDVMQMIVYLRDPADYAVVSQLYDERFPSHPRVFVNAAVCRPGWLVEMECMAIRQTNTHQFPPF